jgi:hypothetical protein
VSYAKMSENMSNTIIKVKEDAERTARVRGGRCGYDVD